LGFVNDSRFTHITSPGGAILLLPGPPGPWGFKEKPRFIGMQPESIAPFANAPEPIAAEDNTHPPGSQPPTMATAWRIEPGMPI